MRFITSLLFALACGCGTYAAGAIVWSVCDPQGAGTMLLFTIPIAFAAAVVLALSALVVAMSCGVWNNMANRWRRPRSNRSTSPPPLDDEEVRFAA